MAEIQIARLSIAELSKILSTNGDRVDADDLQIELVERDCPRNTDGTVNLAEFIAWTHQVGRIEH